MVLFVPVGDVHGTRGTYHVSGMETAVSKRGWPGGTPHLILRPLYLAGSTPRQSLCAHPVRSQIQCWPRLCPQTGQRGGYSTTKIRRVRAQDARRSQVTKPAELFDRHVNLLPVLREELSQHQVRKRAHHRQHVFMGVTTL